MSYDKVAFERNYKYLMENMTGSWFSGVFSKGDEATMREALAEIAKTPEGQSIISQLPPNFQINARHHLNNDNIGFYNGETNSVELLSKEGIKPQTLLHELKHAVQEQQGLSYASGLSKNQMMCTDKLSEAETISWERVLYATAKHKYGQKYADTHWKVDDFEASDDALYKSCLNRCNGNEEKAQKMMVGKLIPKYMNATSQSKPPYGYGENSSGWVHHYDNQALRNALALAKQGKLTKEGDIKKFNKILSHYCKKYGMSKKDIAKYLEEIIIPVGEEKSNKVYMELSCNNESYKGMTMLLCKDKDGFAYIEPVFEYISYLKD